MLLVILLSGCSKTPVEKGDEAFAQGRYAEAIRAYLEATKEQPENPALKEKIATAYFKQGEKLFQMRKVLKAFEARVELGAKYVPEQPSEQMRKTLSQVYYALAMAYKNTPPENPYQKKTYFDKTLSYLEKAIRFDENNNEARQALQSFQNEHFQEMLDKGIDRYNKGKVDETNYILADYYLTNANKFKPGDPQVQKYLRLARKKALNILDPGQRIPLAITDQLKKDQYLAFYVVVHNIDLPKIAFDASNFYLISDEGSEIQGEANPMFDSYLKPVTLGQEEETEGVVAFPIKPNQKYHRLELRFDGEVLGYKNLP